MELYLNEHTEISVQNSEIASVFKDNDNTASSRKQDHITLAFRSQVQQMSLDQRFYYEPLLSAHPDKISKKFRFLGKDISAPLWVSSMTGGTEYANIINHNLARAAKDFGFGMGLGSCRSLLTDDSNLKDFDVRHMIGDDLPLYANLGIAQIEKLIETSKLDLIDRLLGKLKADGLIVHINPMQEWLQPEGDRYNQIPLVTLKRLIDTKPDLKVIVKEVGQGFGPESLKALLKLPVQALDFAAAGGTSFAMLELLRSNEQSYENYKPFTQIGHSAEEMVDMVNKILDNETQLPCKEIIISGGIQNFLDGYYLTNKIKLPAVYGQASALLKHARNNYDELYQFIDLQIKGFRMAESFLRIK